MTADPETLAARRLLAALLLRAACGAVAGDPRLAAPAREWLRGEGADWATWLDLDPERVTRFLDGLPVLVQPGLPGM